MEQGYEDEISPDGKVILTQGGSPIMVWDVETGKSLHSFDAWQGAISPNGKYISTVGPNGVQIWDAHTYALVNTLDKEDYVGLFSPDDQYIVTHPAQDTTVLWNVQTGQKQHIFTFDTDLILAAFLRSKTYLLILVDDIAGIVVHTWDLDADKEVNNMTLGVRLIDTAATFSVLPDGKSIITGADEIQLWDLQTGKELGRFC